MLEVEKEMSIHSCLKNKKYVISKRDYTDDYSNTPSKKYDMTMSGKYIGKYPKLELSTDNFDKYPSHYEVNKLTKEIKIRMKTNKEVVIGSGSNGILQNLIKLFFSNGGNLVTPYYTFNQAEYAVTALNGYTKRVVMDEENISFSNILKSIDKNTKMVYICNPNNPTGIYYDSKTMLQELKKINNKIPIVIDESSIEFTKNNSLLEYNLPPNIIVLRTFSKAYGLANLRIGYMICNKTIKKLYEEKITVNEVSGLSCEIAYKVLKETYYLDNIKYIIKERNRIIKELKKINIECYDTKSNTIMTKTTFEEKVYKYLCKKDISVVKVFDFNNKLHFRIAIQEKKVNDIFIKTIAEYFK